MGRRQHWPRHVNRHDCGHPRANSVGRAGGCDQGQTRRNGRSRRPRDCGIPRCSLAIVVWPVAVSQATAHAAGVVFGPALAAVTLGIAGHRAFTRRIGRNETFNHAGNATAALIAGGAAYLFGPSVVFYLLAAMSLASVVSVLAIPEATNDHDLARGLDDTESDDARRE